jgi:hypothetical protein
VTSVLAVAPALRPVLPKALRLAPQRHQHLSLWRAQLQLQAQHEFNALLLNSQLIASLLVC